MVWVHCNRCFREPSDPGSWFFMSNCGHVACNSCVTSLCSKCPTCSKDNVQMMKLNSSLSRQYQLLFTEPRKHLKARQNEVYKIRNFQDKQMANLSRGMIKMQQIIKEMKRMSKAGNQTPNQRNDLGSKSLDPFQSSSIHRSSSLRSTSINPSSVPRHELRATFDARNERSRSKSSNGPGYMQGRITTGPVLSISNRLS